MENPKHIAIDMFECSKKERLLCQNEIREFLKECVVKMEMTPVGEPQVFYFKGDTDDKCGVTGCQVIAESLISVHTYGETNSVYCDLFSCKPFDVSQLVLFVREFFEASQVFVSNVNRTSLKEAKEAVKDDENGLMSA